MEQKNNDVKLTPSQQSAVDIRGKNILVSAAAGSGKTAVLVKRILKRVMEDDDRTDIDRMLIVTFTNAAAAEMKEKINKKLRSYNAVTLEEIRRRKHQLNCLDDADICTIDSFCKNCVRSYAQELGITQDFRTCDPAEDSIIIDNAVARLTEELYSSGDEDFLALTQYYSARNHDRDLTGLIVKIYNYIQSYAVPEEKLADLFRFWLYDGAELFNQQWARELIREQADDAKRALRRMLRIDMSRVKKNAKSPELLLGLIYREYLEQSQGKGGFGILRDYCAAARMGDFESISELYNKYVHIIDGKLPKESAAVHDYLAEGIKALGIIAKADENGGREEWDKVYEAVKLLRSPAAKSAKRDEWTSAFNAYYSYFFAFGASELSYITQNSDEAERQFQAVSAMAKRLVDMVMKLSEIVSEVKHRRNTYSFADIEHFAYKLLTAPEHTDIARLYRKKYTDILIDEYQDTNGLQDAIFAGISRGNNMFMVGDLKQSIYAFRGGDPTIFKKKGAEYTPYDSPEAETAASVRIDLADNFRSSGGVVDSVNELFGCIMSDRMGDVEYIRKGEYLVCGRARIDSDEVKAGYKRGELVVLPFLSRRGEREVENGAAVDRSTIEARYVARRIREMVDGGEQICDEGKLRPVEYRDFTIISSSVKDIMNVYSKALRSEGIPIGVPAMGYYDFFEISVVLSLLRVLVNRRADAALVTVMRSPIGAFTDDELAQISRVAPELPFYERLTAFAEGDTPAADKARGFIALVERFESYKHYKSAANIIYDIYTETGFYDFVGAMEGGRQAQQNLTLFYERAKRYSETGVNGLYSFVRYVDKLREESDDTAGAAPAGETQNVVRMMTIHASKGLEFPVVFAVSCGKKFPSNSADDGIINREAGIGLKYVDTESRRRTDTPLYKWVKLHISRENHSEDARKLYVSLTRAREQLICVMSLSVGSRDDYDLLMEKFGETGRDLLVDVMKRRHGDMTAPRILTENVKGFYEWLLSAYYAGQHGKKIGTGIIDGVECGMWTLDDSYDSQSFYTKDVYSIIRSRYPFEMLAGLPSKTSVSKIKEERKSDFDDGYSTELTELTDENGNSKDRVAANVLGTAYHKVMELAEPRSSADVENVKVFIEGLCSDGKLERGVGNRISPKLIAGFFGGFMGERVAAAYERGQLHRESPFEIAITPDQYNTALGEADFTEDDRILLQGTIDCWFEENGSCVIIDYKTDRKQSDMSDEEFAARKAEEYRVQLDLYSTAINMLDGRQVTERYLYLFATGEFVSVPEV